MKTEREIRKHMRDLIVLHRLPCRCAGTDHEFGCIIGGKMMEAVAGTLAWVLGENEKFQPMVDEIARRAADYIASG